MEIPARNPSSLPVIKCSSCGKDVQIAGLAEHLCATTPPPVSMLPPPPPLRTELSTSLRNMRSQRPLLPKIDPSVGFRTQAYQGELTPASSGHNSLISPVSASSPWPTVRKASIPGPRRPPSPELANLDCAFPPFPLPTRAATTRKRDISTTHRSDTKRSRSRDPQKCAAQNSRRPPLTREGTANSSATKSNDALQQQQRSRPSSPLGSGSQSQRPKTDGRQQGTEFSPDVQSTSPKSAAAIETHAAKGSTSERGSSSQSSTIESQPEPPGVTTIDPGFSAFDFGGSEISRPELRPLGMGLNDRSQAYTEPAYKSKRPPPILSNQEILPLAKSSTAPQPSPSGSFSRNLGRLFSRRRSQSATSRRDVVRQALSDEPDSFDNYFAGQGMLSPGSDRSFFAAEPSPLGTSPLRSPDPLPSHEESLKALEGMTPEPAVDAPPVVVVEPAVEEDSSKASREKLSSDSDITKTSDAFEMFGITSTPQGSELIEALRRVSIDSGSSYGSVGFSERTTSSRSTALHMDSVTTELIESPDSTLVKSVAADIPAPLRPKILALSPDSPTDPLFQQGRLSPIPDPAHHPQDANDSVPWIHLELRASSEPVQEPQPSSNNVVKPLVPNKGICRGCSRLIFAGQKSVSSADGRLTGRYHRECFVCQACKTAFPTAEFYVHNDHPYCAHHYHELEDSLCATCGKGIEGLYMETANVAGRGKEKHHPECLKCTTCKIRLNHDYFELSGKVYCERDAFRLATLPKSHDNAPSRPSPLVREYISSGDPGLVKGRNFPERRTTTLMTMI